MSKHTALAGWDGPVMTVSARGLSGRNPPRRWRRPGACCKFALPMARLDARRAAGCFVGDGRYASGGLVWAAHSLGVPVVLHEANVIPGRAVRWLALYFRAVALGFDEARVHLRHPRLELTDSPASAQGGCCADPQLEALGPEIFTLLVIWHAGYRRLNELAPAAVRHPAAGTPPAGDPPRGRCGCAFAGIATLPSK